NEPSIILHKSLRPRCIDHFKIQSSEKISILHFRNTMKLLYFMQTFIKFVLLKQNWELTIVRVTDENSRSSYLKTYMI
uniref:Ovule protein n=1 Tax=Romanomermis culicivorax TaxID=13658 RepID=A0A915K8Q7_ROMCU